MSPATVIYLRDRMPKPPGAAEIVREINELPHVFSVLMARKVSALVQDQSRGRNEVLKRVNEMNSRAKSGEWSPAEIEQYLRDTLDELYPIQ